MAARAAVAARAAAARVAAKEAAVMRTEVVSGQSPEGKGTAWFGESIGVARAARVARVEAVAVASATQMRVATGVVGTKGT